MRFTSYMYTYYMQSGHWGKGGGGVWELNKKSYYPLSSRNLLKGVEWDFLFNSLWRIQQAFVFCLSAPYILAKCTLRFRRVDASSMLHVRDTKLYAWICLYNILSFAYESMRLWDTKLYVRSRYYMYILKLYKSRVRTRY